MKINIFSIPLYATTIDVNEIRINHVDFVNTWLSKTESSHNFNNEVCPDSTKYLLKNVSDLISEDIGKPHRLHLKNIWENHYKENDYQDKHIHPMSHFSFIIYKKISESNTLFFHPAEKLLQSYYENMELPIFMENFKPDLKQGQLLVFPSFLEHMVLKHNHSETIAGNILIELLEKKS